MTGKWEEYNKAFDASGNIILTREIEVLSQMVTERVIVPNGANVANDDIIGFVNGCVSLYAANKALQADASVVSADINEFDRRSCYTKRSNSH